MGVELEAVIFDLDGVITDTAEFHFIAWKNIAEEIGIKIDRSFNEALKGVSRTESLERILRYGGREGDFSQEEKEILARKKNSLYKELITKITRADLLPGIWDLLQDLRSGGIKLGLASMSKNVFSVVDNLQVRKFFDVIVDVREVERGKPDPEIFLRAAKDLGVQPKDCLAIEDAEAGVKAIKKAGMFAIGIGSEKELAEADLILPTTGGLSLSFIQRVFTEGN